MDAPPPSRLDRALPLLPGLLLGLVILLALVSFGGSILDALGLLK